MGERWRKRMQEKEKNEVKNEVKRAGRKFSKLEADDG